MSCFVREALFTLGGDILLFNPSSRRTFIIGQHNQAVDQARKGCMGRIDLTNLRAKQPPGQPGAQPLQQASRRRWSHFPAIMQRGELLRQVGVSLCNIGQQGQAVAGSAAFYQSTLDLRRKRFAVGAGRNDEERRARRSMRLRV